MPSLQTWQQAVPPSELYFNSSMIQLRNHHYPPGGLNISNFENTTKGMAEMTIAAQRWYPVHITALLPPFFSSFLIYCSENPQYIYIYIFSQDYISSMTDKNIYEKQGPKQDRPPGKLLGMVSHNTNFPSRFLQIRNPILSSWKRISESPTRLFVLATRRYMASPYLGRD